MIPSGNSLRRQLYVARPDRLRYAVSGFPRNNWHGHGHTRRVSEPSGDPRDPRGLRADAPVLDAWLNFTSRAEAGELLPMCVPGHKQRQDLVGTVIAGDAPFYGGVDTIKHADSLRVEAERRAAALWGADWCRFSVAGSTHGNQALALAVG
jgi:arginine decarboxylase